MDLQHEGQELMPIIWTEPEADDDPKLMSVLYTRVQPQHPEFTTTHDSINQAVNIKLSTIVMKADPVDLVSLYDFIMKTFVPAKAVDVSEPPEAPSESLVVTDNQDKGVTAAQNADTIKVSVTLASVRGKCAISVYGDLLTCIAVVLIDGSTSISTLTLPTADISLLLHGGSTKLSARMGNLLLVDDTGSSGEDKAIVSFKGGEFMDLQYESYAPMDVRSDGAQSSVVLRAGSLQAVFWERPLRDTYAYLTKLARLKGLYDAATEAAAQRASEIVKLKFDVSVKSPVLIFPAGVDNTKCTFTMKLGEITANNAFEGNSQLITASLNGLQLNSDTELPDGVSSLKMIDDVSVSADIIQTPPSSNNDAAPDVQVCVTSLTRPRSRKLTIILGQSHYSRRKDLLSPGTIC
jgi:vacuolar protein sorting-associated protein 13A/C